VARRAEGDRCDRRCCPISSSCAACRSTFVLTTGPSLSPKPCRSGLAGSRQDRLYRAGSPWENGYVESFNAGSGTSCWTARFSLAQGGADRHRELAAHYNAVRRTNALSYRPPDTESVRAALAAWPSTPPRSARRPRSHGRRNRTLNYIACRTTPRGRSPSQRMHRFFPDELM